MSRKKVEAAPTKYELYENSVQDPVATSEWVEEIYRWRNRRPLRSVREDFAGTFHFSATWVTRNAQNTALALDLDPEPLEYGKKTHFSKLTLDQQKRLTLSKINVQTVTRPQVDLVYAGNFSYFIFKEEEELLKYFKAVHASLKSDGVFMLESVGGPDMMKSVVETQKIKVKGFKKFQYFWDQKSFNPITHDLQCAIHYKIDGQKKMENVFEYDWRLWTPPEVRFLLKQAGFSKSVVFWEKADARGNETGEYERTENGYPFDAWVSYLIGLK